MVKLLTTKQVALRLRVEQATVRKLIKNNTLRGSRIGTRFKVENDTVTMLTGSPLPLLTVADVADELGLCFMTVYGMAEQGRIPCFKLGRKILRFRREQIDIFIKEGE